LVRVKCTNTAVNFIAGKVYVRSARQISQIKLVATLALPAAPDLGFNDETNTVAGLDATYEYRIGFESWTP
jgi:hypothetical protein